MWAFEVPAEAYQLGRTRVFFKAGEISRVEAILRTDLSGEAGVEIDARMREALDRRRQALEAVDAVQVLLERNEEVSVSPRRHPHSSQALRPSTPSPPQPPHPPHHYRTNAILRS